MIKCLQSETLQSYLFPQLWFHFSCCYQRMNLTQTLCSVESFCVTLRICVSYQQTACCCCLSPLLPLDQILFLFFCCFFFFLSNTLMFRSSVCQNALFPPVSRCSDTAAAVRWLHRLAKWTSAGFILHPDLRKSGLPPAGFSGKMYLSGSQLHCTLTAPSKIKAVIYSSRQGRMWV